MHLRGGGLGQGQCVTGRRGRLCVCMCMCVHSKSTLPPTHLHGLLQVLGGCTEAVEGEVLYNGVGPTHLEGTPYKPPPLTDVHVNIYTVQVKQSEVEHVARTVGLPLGSYIYTNNIHTHVHTHVCSLAS